MPVIIFTILFGLSMDYHVFILTRIKEARDRGLPSDAAVARGIAITSGTVTSAAAIMVAVFAVFVTLQLYVIKQLGLGLAVAVLLDATVIRTILLPATMHLLGDWNWWLPALPGLAAARDDRGRGGADARVSVAGRARAARFVGRETCHGIVGRSTGSADPSRRVRSSGSTDLAGRGSRGTRGGGCLSRK